jgi:hypothetical protein
MEQLQDLILNSQKKAIWIQMNEYKRNCELVERENALLKQRLDQPGSTLTEHLQLELIELKENYLKVLKKLDRQSLTTTPDSPKPPPPDIPVIQVNHDSQILADSRLAEIESLSKHIASLESLIADLQVQLSNSKVQLGTLPDLERHVKSQVLAKDEALAKLHASMQSNQVLATDKKLFVQQVQEQESKERKILETELRKQSQDLVRIRTNRDALQKSLDLLTVKQESTARLLQESLDISNARKDRISALEAEVQRLQMKIAANIGEPALMEFFHLNPTENPYQAISSKNKYLALIKIADRNYR